MSRTPPQSGLSDKRKGIYEASRYQARSTRLVHIDTAAWRPQEGRLTGRLRPGRGVAVAVPGHRRLGEDQHASGRSTDEEAGERHDRVASRGRAADATAEDALRSRIGAAADGDREGATLGAGRGGQSAARG
jgi:hypothetical protein